MPDEDDLLRDFVTSGLVVVPPEKLGVSAGLHETIYEQEKTAFRAKKVINTTLIPDVLKVLAAPGLVQAVDRLAGPNWAIVPFTHNTPFVSGAYDQHWHKDDNGPYNARWVRHHQAVQLEMLYFPQSVAEDMGPTATIPYSQYWTFDHEENHDNFAGADHLDFNYQLTGMETVAVTGPRSNNDEEVIVNRHTQHDHRMREAVAGTGWPLMRQYEAAPLEAGSVLLYSHNLFHRGNHRRDPFENWRENPRFMWRFWIYRTTEPGGEGLAWQPPVVDSLTGMSLDDVPASLHETWRYQHHWSLTGQAAVPRYRAVSPADLAADLRSKGDDAEPRRIGAGYLLAAHADRNESISILDDGLNDERENVRRAAGFGLIAAGDDATGSFLTACQSPRKWVRRAGVVGLGDAARPTREVVDALSERLLKDASVYVRSCAAHALGCLTRRAAVGDVDLLPRILDALLASLQVEANRLGMDKAQDRSIKFVRPTDECDVCEGMGIDYGVDRFEPVRSSVRENALVAMVIVCTHGDGLTGEAVSSAGEALARITASETNVFAAGLALDALTRLAHNRSEPQKHLFDLLDEARGSMPILCQESLLRARA